MEQKKYKKISKNGLFDPLDEYDACYSAFRNLYIISDDADISDIKDIVSEVKNNEFDFLSGGQIHVLFKSRSLFEQLAEDEQMLAFCRENKVHPIFDTLDNYFDLFDEKEYKLEYESCWGSCDDAATYLDIYIEAVSEDKRKYRIEDFRK